MATSCQCRLAPNDCCIDPGHKRKYLVVVDESSEVEAALYFAASRISHSNGSIALLYVIEPQDYQHWVGVRQVQLEEETNKAQGAVPPVPPQARPGAASKT